MKLEMSDERDQPIHDIFYSNAHDKIIRLIGACDWSVYENNTQVCIIYNNTIRIHPNHGLRLFIRTIFNG